jgi:hypothetical protein
MTTDSIESPVFPTDIREFQRPPRSETCSAGRTRTYNQWISSSAQTVHPVQVGHVIDSSSSASARSFLRNIQWEHQRMSSTKARVWSRRA